MTRDCYLGIDIGGTRIKAILLKIHNGESAQNLAVRARSAHPTAVPSRLSRTAGVDVFIDSLRELLEKIGATRGNILGVGISTAGGVNDHGTAITHSAPHLAALTSPEWMYFLEKSLDAPVTLINDAEAVALGAAAFGTFKGDKTYFIAPIGTGLGSFLLRNGRRWGGNTLFHMPQFGCVYTLNGTYDTLVSTRHLAANSPTSILDDVIKEPDFEEVRASYVDHLAGIFSTAATLYGVDEVCMAGGCVNAAVELGWDLEGALQERLTHYPTLTDKDIKITMLQEGNQLPLIGAILLARGHAIATKLRRDVPYETMETEKPFDPDLRLNEMSHTELLENLLARDQEAGDQFKHSIPAIESVIGKALPRLQAGGRLIYVGCGTSGRLAAIDAVELERTFGVPRDRVIALVSGGIQDAAIEIESGFEEDASAVPEMLLLNLDEKDVVIGISVSGLSFYVQSALAYAKAQKAQSVLIESAAERDLPFCDEVIPLNSGAELIAGSTRLKAGTATRRVLSFLSTALMISMGKVYGCYMVNLWCCNDKLVERAVRILERLFHIFPDRAKRILQEQQYHLDRAIAVLEAQKARQQ